MTFQTPSKNYHMTISHLIQKQVPLGSSVIFTLKSGKEVAGMLSEMSRDHVALEQTDGIATILIETIGSWKVISLEARQHQASQRDVEIISKTQESPHTDENNTIDAQLQLLREIQVKFDAYINALHLLEPTPFSFEITEDELRSWQKSDAANAWNSAKNKFEYAAKINELSGKFGRIQPIIAQLKTIEARFPRSLSVKRQIAFLDYLSGNFVESIKRYEEISLISKEQRDWRNLAAAALKKEMHELAHLALHNMFQNTDPTFQMPEWYWYVYLSAELGVQYQITRLLRERQVSKTPETDELFLNSILYLMIRTSGSDDALKLLQQVSNDTTLSLSAVDSVFPKSESAAYQQTTEKLVQPTIKQPPIRVEQTSQLHKGKITRYLSDRNYGFILAENGTQYFFHKTAIADEKLVAQLQGGSLRLEVTFEHTDGPKGPVAVSVSLERSLKQIFELAQEYASDADYPKAIAQIRKVLTIDPDYLNAQELHDLWRSYARNTGVPQGSNPYAKAKRVQLIEKDLGRAIELFKRAIKEGDYLESAVKDLAAVYVQVGQPENAILVLNQYRTRVHDPQSVDNLLVGFYQRAEQYEAAIELLKRQLAGSKTTDKKSHFLTQIGTCYLRQGNYSEAEKQFREVLSLQPNNQVTRRNLAVCLLNQDKLGEAEKLLNQLLDVTLDDKAAELLKVVQQTRLTGRSAAIQIETVQSISASAVSELAEFFLDRCTFQGVRADHVREGRYDVQYAEADIQALERLAAELRTSRPRERAAFYLSAAKIYLLKDDNAPSEQFYRHLSRSFASTGDIYLSEGRHLNAIQEMYCEALAIYDVVQATEKGKDIQGPVNATVRYVASILGAAHVPRSSDLSFSILDDMVLAMFQTHPQLNRALDMLAYLTLRSRYAMERVLRAVHKQIQAKSTFQAQFRTYLDRKIGETKKLDRFDDFVETWKEVRRKFLDNYRLVASTLRLVGEFEIKAASLESSIEQLKSRTEHLILDLDQEIFRQILRVLDLLLDLSKQDTFDDQDRLCLNVKLVAQELIDEIENNPTKLAVEEILPLLKIILKKTSEWQENLYQSSMPQLNLRVPLESFTPDRQGAIEIQVVVENRRGCSPAETLELVLQEDRELFQMVQQSVKLDGSLRGGEQRILRVPVKVTPKAQQSETFSLPVYAQYTTRSGEIERTRVNSFPILLYSKDDFAEIRNPYAEYAEGGIVGNPQMFYGRKELIARVATTLRESYAQSKCVVIYGQKRAGKSSILYHLTKEIEGVNVLTLDVGNIASTIDENSKVPVLYQILWSVMRKLRNAIEDRIDVGYAKLNLVLPSDIDFYKHPAPLQYFVDLFGDFQRESLRTERWKQLRPVVLIDEFSYIFDQINKGYLSSEFMKNWKALLQNNFFNAVLVGQDVMPKFKDRFPNEFGTTQDEQVSYLRRDDAIRLIEEPIRLEDGGSRYREKAIERILDLTAGSPFYIQIICNRLVQYMNRKRVRLVTDADVEQITSELITGASSLGKDKFDNLINSGDTSPDAINDADIVAVLTAIAVNSRTGRCSRSSIACETKVPIDDILEDLEGV
jgi:tetratricopeptide (TPR) repeat protein